MTMSHPVCAHQYKKKRKEKTPETKKNLLSSFFLGVTFLVILSIKHPTSSVDTYRYRNTIFFLIIWKFNNKLRASLLLTVIEWPKTTHHLYTVLGWNFTLGRHFIQLLHYFLPVFHTKFLLTHK